jgi:hypothetical protein
VGRIWKAADVASCHGILIFLEGCKEKHKNEVTIAGFPGRVSNRDHPNSKQDCQQLSKEVR